MLRVLLLATNSLDLDLKRLKIWTHFRKSRRTEMWRVLLLGTNSLDLAGDIIQSLGNYLGLEDLGQSAQLTH